MVVVPLVHGLSRLVVLVHATCNRFTHRWVAEQWRRVEALCEKHVSPKLGPLQGHGSDGDERRFKLQKQRMNISPKEAGRFGL